MPPPPARTASREDRTERTQGEDFAIFTEDSALRLFHSVPRTDRRPGPYDARHRDHRRHRGELDRNSRRETAMIFDSREFNERLFFPRRHASEAPRGAVDRFVGDLHVRTHTTRPELPT